MTQTVFVVSEIGFEYDDEIYHRPYGCDDAGVPTIAFKNRQRAEQEAVKLTISKLKHENLGEYGYSIDEVIGDFKGFTEVLTEAIGPEKSEKLVDDLSDDMYSYSDKLGEILNTLNQDQLTRLISSLQIEFYEVVEVELSDE
ncbi:hypothetical protein RsoM2USA_140 [Ralstonia phage RsoM2USA]|nr:hypothetical protein RsoM2USA_140 [Ralstonia phage RsoM2USA]